jgi:hypothetical protein
MYYAILIRCFPRSVTYFLRSFLFIILDLYTFIKLTVIITSCPRYTFLSSQHIFISLSLLFSAHQLFQFSLIPVPRAKTY